MSEGTSDTSMTNEEPVKPYVIGYAITPTDHFPGWTTPLTIDMTG